MAQGVATAGWKACIGGISAGQEQKGKIKKKFYTKKPCGVIRPVLYSSRQRQTSTD